MRLVIRQDQIDALRADRVARTRSEYARQLTGPGVQATERGKNGLDFRDAEGRIAQLDWTEDRFVFTSPLGRQIRLRYDRGGNLAEIVDPAGFATRMERDAAGRMVALDRGEFGRCSFTYGFQGRLRRVRFPDDVRQVFHFDDAGHIERIERDRQTVVSFERDPSGELRAYTDALGRTTRFEDTPDGRLARIVFADGSDQRFAYDEAGGLRAVWHGDRLYARYTTDEEGEVTSADFADGDRLLFEHGPSGLLRARTALHYCSWAHTPLGNIAQERIDDRVTRFERNAIGEVIATTLPSGQRVEYARDDDGQIIGVEAWGKRFDLEHHVLGLPQRVTYPNGTVTETEIHRLCLDRRHYTRGADGTPLLDRRYEYDPRDRLARLQTERWERRYSYDANGRLTGVVTSERQGQPGLKGSPVIGGSDTDPEARWGADGPLIAADKFFADAKLEPNAMGNRTRYAQGPAAYNARDQIVRRGSETFEHDERGALVRRRDERGDWRYVYTDADRLAEIWCDGIRVARYEYDAIGRRLLKETAAGTTRFYWAALQLVGEHFVAADGSERICEYLYLPNAQSPLAMRIDGAVYCIHSDRLGMPLLVTDERGRPVWRGDYSAFGEMVVTLDEVYQPFRFPGQYHDAESGLHYNLARSYDPSLGRYLTLDPIGVAGGSLNLYLYGDGDPINMIDPFGTFAFIPLLILAAKAAAVIAGGAAVGAGVMGGTEAALQKMEHGEIVDKTAIKEEAKLGGKVGGVGAAAGLVAAPLVTGAGAVTATTATAGAVGTSELLIASTPMLVAGGTAAVEGCAERKLRGESYTPTDTMNDFALGAVSWGIMDNVGRWFGRKWQRGKRAWGAYKQRKAAQKAANEAAEKRPNDMFSLFDDEPRIPPEDLVPEAPVRKPTKWDDLAGRVDTDEVDQIITTEYGKHLPEDLKKGGMVAKTTSVIPDDEFRERMLKAKLRKYHVNSIDELGPESRKRLERELDVTLAYERRTEYGREIIVNGDKARADTLFHEGLHSYAHPDWRKRIEPNLDEAVTEYLSIQKMGPRGIPSTALGYKENVEIFSKYAKNVDPDVIERAYFGGDIDALKEAFNKPGRFGWSSMCQELGAMGSY